MRLLETKYIGIIYAKSEQKKELVGMGIKVGSYNLGGFECEVDQNAMELLNECWGKFYWSLNICKEIVNEIYS